MPISLQAVHVEVSSFSIKDYYPLGQNSHLRNGSFERSVQAYPLGHLDAYIIIGLLLSSESSPFSSVSMVILMLQPEQFAKTCRLLTITNSSASVVLL